MNIKRWIKELDKILKYTIKLAYSGTSGPNTALITEYHYCRCSIMLLEMVYRHFVLFTNLQLQKFFLQVSLRTHYFTDIEGSMCVKALLDPLILLSLVAQNTNSR